MFFERKTVSSRRCERTRICWTVVASGSSSGSNRHFSVGAQEDAGHFRRKRASHDVPRTDEKNRSRTRNQNAGIDPSAEHARRPKPPIGEKCSWGQLGAVAPRDSQKLGNPTLPLGAHELGVTPSQPFF